MNENIFTAQFSELSPLISSLNTNHQIFYNNIGISLILIFTVLNI